MTDRDPDAGNRRRRIDSVIPDILKRAVERGVEKATEAPDNIKTFVNEMKLPKELAQAIVQQIDETKAGLFRVVATEMGEFLSRTNLAEELQKLMMTTELEVKATVSFKPKGTGKGVSVTIAEDEPRPSDRRRRKNDRDD